jgi:acylphosphatase
MSGASASARLSARVIGRVQGVGYRWWVNTQARSLGLVGWVANDPDERTVEVVAEGSPASLQQLERLLRLGPPGAYVEQVEASIGPASGSYSRFEIVRS